MLHETLLAETQGKDTTTQLWRHADGTYRLRVLALPEGGAEALHPQHSPRVFDDRAIGEAQARMLFGSATARRYVEPDEAFPG